MSDITTARYFGFERVGREGFGEIAGQEGKPVVQHVQASPFEVAFPADAAVLPPPGLPPPVLFPLIARQTFSVSPKKRTELKMNGRAGGDQADYPRGLCLTNLRTPWSPKMSPQRAQSEFARNPRMELALHREDEGIGLYCFRGVGHAPSTWVNWADDLMKSRRATGRRGFTSLRSRFW